MPNTSPTAASSSVTSRASAPLSDMLKSDRPLVMGILNITPDSFSDGGQFSDPQRAIDHAREMAGQGADIIDIGAESTRPYGAKQVSEENERARLMPVLRSVVEVGLPVSIDTMKSSVADWALDMGAAIVNDVWGLQRDPDMATVVAKHDAPVVVMHNRDAVDEHLDIIADMIGFFTRTLKIAEQAGIERKNIVLDPGIGFGKTPAQSITCLAHLAELKCFGLPLLVGASRKRFIDTLFASTPSERIGGSIASHLIAIQNGAAIVRVHDVKETVQALRVAAAIEAVK
jgi:dihydropteroate synthase